MSFPALELVALSTRIHGAGAGGDIAFSGASIITLSSSPSASASLRFTESGLVIKRPGTLGNFSGDGVWGVSVAGADFEIRATMISGTTTPSGDIPFGSFISLSVDRDLFILAPSPGSEEFAQFLIEIREIAVPANITSGQCNLFVENSPF